MNGFEKHLADKLHERLDGVHSATELPPTVARRARRGRRLTAASGMMTLVMLIGGGAWFGAAAFDGGTDVAHGQCPHRPDPDLTIYVSDGASVERIGDLGAHLSSSDAVEEVTFVSKRQTFAEFKERYRDQPEFYENLPRDALPARFDVELEDGVDPSEFAEALLPNPTIDDVRFDGGLAGILCPKE